MKFRGGQVDYFGKKFISLNMDILFTKVDCKLKKYIYFTSMQRADQDAQDVLAIADNLLRTVQKNCPYIKTLYAKLDNAG